MVDGWAAKAIRENYRLKTNRATNLTITRSLNSILEKITAQRIIPVVEIDSAKNAMPLAEAIMEGGIPILEITLRTSEAIDAIEIIRNRVPEMLIGAGTVLSLEQSAQVDAAGAHFGVSPGLNPAIVNRFNEMDLPFIPGVMTPTEIESATKLNCSLLKFFPASVAGGPDFLRAISGPYANQDIRFCATGGVTLDNMNEYLDIPMVNMIGGSWIASRQQIFNQNWSQITKQVEQAVRKLKERDDFDPNPEPPAH